MQTLREYSIMAQFHDEVIIKCENTVMLDDICKQMIITPSWAKGLLLNADGYEYSFYKNINKR